MLVIPALLLAAHLLGAAPAHPESFSTSTIVVSGSALRLELRCQTQSLLEALGPQTDRDGDGWYGDAELLALRDELESYVVGHYVLRADSGGDAARGVVLQGALTDLGLDDPDVDVASPTQWVDLAFEYRSAELIRDLLIDVTLFEDTAPDHRDLCRLVWNGGEPLETLFWRGESRRYYAPGAPPEARPLTGWIRLGFDHILGGWDHIAFVLVLIVAAGSLRSLIGVITAFTLAHSLTLALAALGVVHVSSRPVEMVIALSIAWVGIANLLARAPRARWREAFVFGLVHGLGFAGFLGEALYGEPRLLRALIGFNLGVECGQLAVLLPVVALLHALRRMPLLAPADGTPREAGGGGERDAERAASTAWLAPRSVRLPVSAGVALLALYWFGERAGLS